MTNKKLLAYHSISGLIAGIFLIILGVTGSILVFNTNIDQAIHSKYQTYDAPQAFNIDQAIKSMQKHYPDWSIRLIHFKPGETFIFNTRKPEARKLVFVHPNTTQILGEIDERNHLSKWILKLHYSFHSGASGRILVFIIGILFFISLVSGIVLFRKSIYKTLLFQVKVKKKHKRTYYSILHRYVGVWALLLNLVLAFTGIFLGYKVAMAGLRSSVASSPPIIEASIAKTLQDLKDKQPDFTPEYIRLPTSVKSNIVFNGPFKNDPFYYSKYYNKIEANYLTGEIEKVRKTANQDFLYRFNSTILPLHYGQYAGIFSKIVYAFIGLSGPFLSITGFYLWLKKTKTKKKKRAKFEN